MGREQVVKHEDPDSRVTPEAAQAMHGPGIPEAMRNKGENILSSDGTHAG
jgi:hypothetical protein